MNQKRMAVTELQSFAHKYTIKLDLSPHLSIIDKYPVPLKNTHKDNTMRNTITLLLILTFSVTLWAQRRQDLPYRKDGKWFYTLQDKTYGPFYWVSDIMKKNDRWLFISELKDDGNKSKYFAYTNADGGKKFGPFDYINYRIAGFSPSGSHYYFMAFEGDKETSNQKYFFIIDGEKYGPYTSLTRRVNFHCNDEIWSYKAVRDGRFSGRWHMGGKERLYVMGKEYDILTKPAGFQVESATRVSDTRYEIKVAVDVGSRRSIKTIYYEKE